MDATHTAVNQILGTPIYMPPEAITQADAPSARGDLYALGAVAYFLLTGRPPFMGHTVVEICAHHLHSTPVPPSEYSPRPLPADLERLVLRCLEKKPEDRPADARALGDEFTKLARALPWSAEQARSWWNDHADSVKKRRAKNAGSLHEHDRATVAVELVSESGMLRRA
ncbi:MAG: protein kinase [Polyangiaceae bacterium]